MRGLNDFMSSHFFFKHTEKKQILKIIILIIENSSFKKDYDDKREVQIMMNENNLEQFKEEGDTLKDMTSLKRMLAQEEWVDEARQLPLEDLDAQEQIVAIKCINQDELTDDELDQLEAILGRYRESIREQKPEQTVQAVRDNIQHIKDCDTLLSELEKVRQEEITTIPMKIPKKDGAIKVLIDVYPITDSSILFDPNSHFAPFMDQTEEIINNQLPENTSIEDKQVQEEIRKQSREIIENETDNIELIIELLSQQTSLHEQPRNPEKMEQIYRAMPLVYLAALINKIQPLIIEPVYNVDMDQVFQETSN